MLPIIKMFPKKDAQVIRIIFYKEKVLRFLCEQCQMNFGVNKHNFLRLIGELFDYDNVYFACLTLNYSELNKYQ